MFVQIRHLGDCYCFILNVVLSPKAEGDLNVLSEEKKVSHVDYAKNTCFFA